MTFEIFKDEKSKKKEKKPSINPIYLHIFFLIIIVGILFFYFSDDFSFDTSKEEDNVIFVGSMEDFEKKYSGNLEIYSGDFTLETSSGKFKDTSKTLDIENFSGDIGLDNKSIVLKGVADRISFGSNEFNLGGSEFTLISNKKTTLSIFFEQTNMIFEKGRIKINDKLNYEFENASVDFNNYNSTLTYDGIFSFSGDINSFNLKTKSIGIDYQNQNMNNNSSN